MNEFNRAILAATILSVASVAYAAEPVWQEGKTYSLGQRVSYQNHTYQAIIAHTAYVGAGWNPAVSATLWLDLGVNGSTLPSPSPSPSPSSSPSPSPSPSSSPSPAPNGVCSTPWESGKVYTAGANVSYQGHNFTAKWWVDRAPQSQDTWGGWLDLGTCNQSTPVSTVGLLFDDFSYSNTTQLANNGWLLRSWDGGPGLSNGQWSPNNISFLSDTAQPGNTLMRLKASSNISADQVVGNRANGGQSSQVELMTTEARYQNGTWAARMYFTDASVQGPDGDSVVQTFFGITRYIEGAEPYSEIDFEYLPNGGWGIAAPTMWSGTYAIAAYDPENHVAVATQKSFAGWHTLVMNVHNDEIRFYVDDRLVQSYRGKAQPDHPMYLSFQLWFNGSGLIQSNELREYQEDIDWVYHRQDQQLSTSEVQAQVQQLRQQGLAAVKNIR